IAPLYALHPYPPMHVFSVVMVVLLLGSVGVYLAIEALSGSKKMALAGALGFCILPQVEHVIFCKGTLEVVNLAIFPYVFAALFSRKWGYLYAASFIFALVSTPCIYLVLFIGIAIALFFKAPKQGIIVLIIGLIVLRFDTAVFGQSLVGILPSGRTTPDLFKFYVLKADMKDVFEAGVFNIAYIFILIMTVACLPLLGVMKRSERRWEIMGLFFIASGGFILGLFRGWGWNFQRDGFLIVPIYLAAFVGLVGLREDNNSRDISSM